MKSLSKSKRKISMISKIIIIWILLGLILGIILGLQTVFFKDELVNTHKIFFETRTKRFIVCFLSNFWFIFVLWLIGKQKTLIFLSFILVLIKCFLLGLNLGIIVKANLFVTCFKFFLIDLVLYLPFLGFILRLQILFFDESKKNYEIVLFIGFIGIVLYSLMYALISA